jgi:hypothetical protein
MSGGGIYNADTGEIKVQPTTKPNRPINVPGVGLVQPDEIDEVTGQPKLLVPAPPKASNALPFRSTPQGIMDARTGQITTPAPTKGMTDYQRRQDAARIRNEKSKALDSRISLWDKDIREMEQSIRMVDKEQATLGKRFRPERAAERLEWQKKLVATKELIEAAQSQKAKIGQEIDSEVEPELAPVGPGAVAPQGVLPEPGAVSPAASNTEFVLVFDPSGKPGKIRASQLESALANGYRRR